MTRRFFTEEQFDLVLDSIYDAPGSLEGWNRVLGHLSSFFDAPVVNNGLWDLEADRYLINTCCGIPPEVTAIYRAHYACVDEWWLRMHGKIQMGFVGDGRQFCSNSELKMTEFYCDFLQQGNWLHQCFGVLELRDSAAAMVTMVRREDQPEFSSRELATLREFVPHLQRAFKLHRRAMDVQHFADLQRGLIESLPFGIILLAENGSLILANNLAKKSCALVPLQLTAKGLRVIGTQRSEFESQMAAYWAGGPPPAIQIWRSDGSTVLLAVGRLQQSPLGNLCGCTAIYVHDSMQSPRPIATQLQSAFRLTRAEVRLALLLAEGMGMPEASAKLQISKETARTQLKSVFQKTSTRRQSELCKLLVSMRMAP